MLLGKSEAPFDDNSTITELKMDGFRCIWTKFEGKVRIYTRHNNEITGNFPELLLLDIEDGTVLDGEIIVTDDDGKPNFEKVMERFRSKKSPHEISFTVFDVLYYKGEKVTGLSLLQRKELLEKVIPQDTPLLTKVQWTRGNGVAYFNLVKEMGLEGIVSKRENSTYQIDKRSDDWKKVINYQYDNVLIGGLRKDEFGLLLLFEDNRKYAGMMEFMPTPNRKEFYRQYRDFIVEENDKMIYLDPKMKIKVKYRNLTSKGLLRIPSFVEWAE